MPDNPIDHGKGIDDYYKRKREAGEREREKLREMRKAGASSYELQKQEQRAIDAADCGD